VILPPRPRSGGERRGPIPGPFARAGHLRVPPAQTAALALPSAGVAAAGCGLGDPRIAATVDTPSGQHPGIGGPLASAGGLAGTVFSSRAFAKHALEPRAIRPGFGDRFPEDLQGSHPGPTQPKVLFPEAFQPAHELGLGEDAQSLGSTSGPGVPEQGEKDEGAGAGDSDDRQMGRNSRGGQGPFPASNEGLEKVPVRADDCSS
jgi:hypothetical protein